MVHTLQQVDFTSELGRVLGQSMQDRAAAARDLYGKQALLERQAQLEAEQPIRGLEAWRRYQTKGAGRMGAGVPPAYAVESNRVPVGSEPFEPQDTYPGTYNGNIAPVGQGPESELQQLIQGPHMRGRGLEEALLHPITGGLAKRSLEAQIDLQKEAGQQSLKAQQAAADAADQAQGIKNRITLMRAQLSQADVGPFTPSGLLTAIGAPQTIVEASLTKPQKGLQYLMNSLFSEQRMNDFGGRVLQSEAPYVFEALPSLASTKENWERVLDLAEIKAEATLYYDRALQYVVNKARREGRPLTVDVQRQARELASDAFRDTLLPRVVDIQEGIAAE